MDLEAIVEPVAKDTGQKADEFKEVFCICFINKKHPWNVERVNLVPNDRVWEKLVGYPVESRTLYTFCESEWSEEKRIFNYYYETWHAEYANDVGKYTL